MPFPVQTSRADVYLDDVPVVFLVSYKHFLLKCLEDLIGTVFPREESGIIHVCRNTRDGAVARFHALGFFTRAS